MNIAWVISVDITDNLLDDCIVENVTSSWGAWRTYAKHNTDNCICSDYKEALSLISANFNLKCNFYISEAAYIVLGKPSNVNQFGGTFQTANIKNKDDIIALSLVSDTNDIVLMSGFKLTGQEYITALNNIIKSNSTTQFVLIDYEYELADWAIQLPNLTSDSITNAKKLLN